MKESNNKSHATDMAEELKRSYGKSGDNSQKIKNE